MLSKELVQEILDYLQRMPYNQVAPLIAKIINEANKKDEQKKAE